MPAEICTATAPAAALIARILALLTDGPSGVPGFPSGVTVTGLVSGAAPANHFLLPRGTRLYSGSLPSAPVQPYAVVWNHQSSQRREKQFCKLWDIPVTVQLAFDRVLTVTDLTEKSEQLELLLFTDYESETAAQRLSVPGSHRVRDIYDIDISPHSVGSDAWTIIQVVFTCFISGLAET